MSLDPRRDAARSTTSATCRRTSSGFPICATSRRAARIDYDVGANWKVIGENYSECYHCPGVHPQLNRLTPYDRGEDFDRDGPWRAAGWR